MTAPSCPLWFTLESTYVRTRTHTHTHAHTRTHARTHPCKHALSSIFLSLFFFVFLFILFLLLMLSQLDDPVGDCDGVYQGKRYFSCPAGHGVFVTKEQIMLAKGRFDLNYRFEAHTHTHTLSLSLSLSQRTLKTSFCVRASRARNCECQRDDR